MIGLIYLRRLLFGSIILNDLVKLVSIGSLNLLL